VSFIFKLGFHPQDWDLEIEELRVPALGPIGEDKKEELTETLR
jgi:hypothetical protein